MKISLNWLKDYIDINIDNITLKQNFNLHSQEVAGLDKLIEASGLVVGHVLKVERHPDADKLSVCQVDVGKEILGIICGAPNVAKGQKVICALDKATLPGGIQIRKTKIRGIESQGMICSLDEIGIEHKYHQEDGIHVLPETAPIGADVLEYMHLSDYVLDLDLTPNRSDLLSYYGVAHDLKAITGERLHIGQPQISEDTEKNPVCVFTETGDCHSYYARVIKDVKIGPSPLWMQSRLIASGIRPKNNIVDVTNYVMLETGQPLHAFDYDKLGTNQIIVRNAHKGEKIITLDDKIRIMEETDIVITDGNGPIALAGVMGGKSTEIDDDTHSILLEAATFNPYAVRMTSKRLDLRSESSLRFERGIDPTQTELAQNRALELFVSLAGGRILKGVNYFDTNSHQPKRILLELDKIQRVTGYAYSVEDIESVCERLDFACHESDLVFRISVPQRRQDINTYQDLIEEIVRIHGYEHIPLTLPKQTTSGRLTDIQELKRRMKNNLLGSGLDEAITYSLVSRKQAVMFDDHDEQVIGLINPLSEERAYLRHSQLPGLLDVLVYNRARKLTDICIFELGKGYFKDSETEKLSGVLTGDYQPLYWRQEKQKIDFFIVKGILEKLFESSGYAKPVFQKPENDLPHLHPGIAATISIFNKQIGFVGRCHPQLETGLGLDETYMFEIDLSILFKFPQKVAMMMPVSKFPAVSRDLALLVDCDLAAAKILETVEKAKIKVLQDVRIFDVYVGDRIESGKKSIALTCTFQDLEKTLSQEEIDRYAAKILKQLETDLGAILRTI